MMYHDSEEVRDRIGKAIAEVRRNLGRPDTNSPHATSFAVEYGVTQTERAVGTVLADLFEYPDTGDEIALGIARCVLERLKSRLGDPTYYFACIELRTLLQQALAYLTDADIQEALGDIPVVPGWSGGGR